MERAGRQAAGAEMVAWEGAVAKGDAHASARVARSRSDQRTQWLSKALSGTQWRSSGTQQHSAALGSTEWRSVAFGGTQWYSAQAPRPLRRAREARRQDERGARHGQRPGRAPAAAAQRRGGVGEGEGCSHKQEQSKALGSTRKHARTSLSEAIRSNQKQSEAIRSNQKQSEAHTCTSSLLEAN